MDPYLRRFLHNWLRDRTFQLKSREGGGVRYSSIRPITRGLPQGGVISPLMWHLFFNDVAEALRIKRQEYHLALKAFTDVVYADDITTIIWAETEEELIWLARVNMLIVQEVLRGLGLRINVKKNSELNTPPQHSSYWILSS